MSSTGASITGQVSACIDAKLPTGPQYKLLDVRYAEWRGKIVVEVKFVDNIGVVNLLFLDTANDLAFLGFEADGSIDLKNGKKAPIRMTGVLTYRLSSEGFPHPWKFETWNTLPDGTRVPHSLSEVTEYVKYTPTADDFDLEKQFGVKPLPLPGNAAAAGRSWWWLHAVAGVLAAVTVGLVVVARRRRATRTHAT